jgi:hypothetical protein
MVTKRSEGSAKDQQPKERIEKKDSTRTTDRSIQKRDESISNKVPGTDPPKSPPPKPK